MPTAKKCYYAIRKYANSKGTCFLAAQIENRLRALEVVASSTSLQGIFRQAATRSAILTI